MFLVGTRRASSFVYVLRSSPLIHCPRTTLSHRRAFVASTQLGQARMPLQVNESRLMESLHHTCQWGPGERWGDASTETGMSRLSLSDTDKQARDWFAETTQSLGCNVTVDEMGNQFAIRAGRKEGPPTCAGSHLDTQPTGGRYDGILGVHAGVEMLRVLQEHDVETEFPIGVINWTNEEGARFPKSMVSSGVWSGEIPLQEAHNLASVVRGDQSTMRSELERIGYLGKVPCSHNSMPIASHFELHIEQGPLLENAEQKIGIVEGVQSYRWYTITVTGQDCHTGTTDFQSRADALLSAAKMIVIARSVADHHGGLASVGIIDAKPGSTNTVPGRVTFSLDIRAREDATVQKIESELEKQFSAVAAHGREVSQFFKHEEALNGKPCKVEWRRDFTSTATKFHEDCIQCVQESAADTFGDQSHRLTQKMVSGAGHDSVYTSKIVPTSMIFVPSKNGISHNPKEYTSPGDCALGAQVLLGAVLRYDRIRKERSIELDVKDADIPAGS